MKKMIFVLLFINTIITSYAQQKTDTSSLKNKTMTYQDVYSVFITKDLKTSKEFYTKWFDFEIVFESSFFILFSSGGEKPISLAFMSEKHPSSPPSNPALNSKAGVFLTLQVEDAKSFYEKLKKAGLKIYYDLKDEPWGQRRFGVIDPNGMYIDIVEQIEPEKGFWEKYPPIQ